MKNKKLMIIISALVMIVAVASITLWLIFKDNNKVKTSENTYTAYVDINPLIKLMFKVSCQNDVCTEPIITDTELINEDAKEIYKDLVIKDKTLKETIELLATTVKDNNITFTEIHIYSNYDKEDEFKVDSVDYEIVLDVKQEQELEQVIDELIIEEANKKTKEIIVPITFPRKVSEMPFEFQVFNEDCTLFFFLEHSDLYVSRGKISVTISGPAELIDSIPDSISEGAFDFFIQAFVDVNDYTLGEHTTYLDITSKNPDVKILSPTSIKVKYEVREKYDIHMCYKVE